VTETTETRDGDGGRRADEPLEPFRWTDPAITDPKLEAQDIAGTLIKRFKERLEEEFKERSEESQAR